MLGQPGSRDNLEGFGEERKVRIPQVLEQRAEARRRMPGNQLGLGFEKFMGETRCRSVDKPLR